MVVRKHNVRLLVKELDPKGIMLKNRRRLRRRKYSNSGSSCTWHIDGYDKLKYYGFSIHECIGGFSREILWLYVGASNKDLNVIAKLCLDMVFEFGGELRYISIDDGTVHSIIELIHIYLISRDSKREKSNLSLERYFDYMSVLPIKILMS